MFRKRFTTDTLPFKLMRNRGEKEQYYVSGTHEPIIEKSVFETAQKVLAEKPSRSGLIKSGAANCVIVKDLSRLGREYIETGRYLRRVFPTYGVRFIAINDNVDILNDQPDDLTVSVKNIINEAYSRDISVKTRSALDIKRRSGDFVGAFTVYGYFKTGDKHKSLTVDPFAANVVRDIFRKRLDGFSAYHIAEELNKAGILSPLAYKRSEGLPYAKGGYADTEDCKWSATTILRILSDEIYTGTMVQGKQTIVSRELFETANKIRSAVREEYRNKPTNAYSENIFRGLVFCPHCGKPLHRQRGKIRKDGTGIYRFHCISPSRVSKATCIGVNINEQEVIDFVFDALKTELSALKKSIPQADKSDSLKQRKSDKQRELNRVQSLIRGLYENLVSGIISSEDYAEFKNGYASKVSDLKAEIDAINSEIEQLETQRKQAAEAWDCAKLFRESKALSADLLNSLVKRIEISHDHEINVIFRGKESL